MGATVAPQTIEQAAQALAAATDAGHAVRFRGGATKLDWGAVVPEPELELHTEELHQVVEHNAGDLTAVLEAGVPLARAQEQFAAADQMLALDPPLGPDAAATVGGVFATADSGPLRHRYGGPRDMVIGITVVLSDGTVARAGGNVIKNVAGYDLAKLFTGSFGTLGMIARVNVRLHPRPPQLATALGSSSDPGALTQATRALNAAPLELEALDVNWRDGRGELLARAGGADPGPRAKRAAELMRAHGLRQLEVTSEDRELWARQRAGQRATEAALVRVAARPSELTHVVAAASACAATLVGRAAVGTSYLAHDPGARAALRERLPHVRAAVLVDGPQELRRARDPWGVSEGPALELMRRIKRRFDPAGACNPGVFVGGL
jgi:glycolate oxidase FAD binding subunit